MHTTYNTISSALLCSTLFASPFSSSLGQNTCRGKCALSVQCFDLAASIMGDVLSMAHRKDNNNPLQHLSSRPSGHRQNSALPTRLPVHRACGAIDGDPLSHSRSARLVSFRSSAVHPSPEPYQNIVPLDFLHPHPRPATPHDRSFVFDSSRSPRDLIISLNLLYLSPTACVFVKSWRSCPAPLASSSLYRCWGLQANYHDHLEKSRPSGRSRLNENAPRRRITFDGGGRLP